MDINLNKAKQYLLQNNYTCVLFDGSKFYHSTQRGVRPLIDFLESKINFNGFVAADKVVGAGAAHIYVLLGVKSIWAKVISADAKRILNQNNISVFFDTEVPYIINRTGDGMCPIEACVKGISNSNIALNTIKQRLKQLS